MKKESSSESRGAILCVKAAAAFGIAFFVSLVVAQGNMKVFVISWVIMGLALFLGSLIFKVENFRLPKLPANVNKERQFPNPNNPAEILEKQFKYATDVVNNPAFHNMSGNIYHRSNPFKRH